MKKKTSVAGRGRVSRRAHKWQVSNGNNTIRSLSPSGILPTTTSNVRIGRSGVRWGREAVSGSEPELRGRAQESDTRHLSLLTCWPASKNRQRKGPSAERQRYHGPGVEPDEEQCQGRALANPRFGGSKKGEHLSQNKLCLI